MAEVVVPDLVGMVVLEAREAGHEAGVVVTSDDLDGPPLAALVWPDLWLVTGQRPPAGDVVGRGSVVRITFRRGGGDEAGVREPRLPSPDPGHLEAARERAEQGRGRAAGAEQGQDRPALSCAVADFSGRDLRGSRFEQVDLRGSEFRAVDLAGARLRAVDLSRVVMRGVELVDVDITGEVVDLTINGVDVAPLITAELDRRHPERRLMRPDTAAGFRAAWDVLERRWGETVDLAQRLPPGLLHEQVDGEWSFTQTLRHLVFATDSWIRRVVLGDPSPWDPLDLPWDEMPDTPGVPHDRAARPPLDVVLELRRDRLATVRQLVDGLTDELLDGHTDPVVAPGWPEPRSYPVRECLLCVLNEEWEHRLYAERDLAVLCAAHGVDLSGGR